MVAAPVVGWVVSVVSHLLAGCLFCFVSFVSFRFVSFKLCSSWVPLPCPLVLISLSLSSSLFFPLFFFFLLSCVRLFFLANSRVCRLGYVLPSCLLRLALHGKSPRCYGIYSPGSLTRRKIWNRIRLGLKGFHMALKACAYRKNAMMLLPRGIEHPTVRPWRVWN